MSVAAQLGIAPHLIGLRTAAADGQSSGGKDEEHDKKRARGNCFSERTTDDSSARRAAVAFSDTFETWERYLTQLRSLRDSIVTRGAIKSAEEMVAMKLQLIRLKMSNKIKAVDVTHLPPNVPLSAPDGSYLRDR
jgi:hypothetical protein